MFIDTRVTKIFTIIILPILLLYKLGVGATLISNTINELEILDEITDLSDVFLEYSLGLVLEVT